MTSKDKIGAIFLAAVLFAYQYIIGVFSFASALSYVELAVLYVCAMGIWFSITAGLSYYKELRAAIDNYQPLIVLVGDAPRPKKPPIWLIPATSLGLCVVFILAAMGTSRLIPDSELITVSIAPIVLVDRKDIRFAGQDRPTRFHNYGLGIVARVLHSGVDTHQVDLLQIIGDIDVTGNEYITAIGKEGDSTEDLDRRYGEYQPYRRLSLIAYPSDAAVIQAGTGEVFVKFLVVEPIESQRMYSGESSDYMGSRKLGSSPKALTRQPYAFDVVEGTTASGQQITGFRLKSGVEFRIRATPKLGLEVEEVKKPLWILRHEWDSRTPQELFFQQDIRDRVLPSEVDPLVR